MRPPTLCSWAHSVTLATSVWAAWDHRPWLSFGMWAATIVAYSVGERMAGEDRQ